MNEVHFSGDTSTGLQRLNIAAALLHGAQALVILLMANDFALPVTGFFWNDVPNNSLDTSRLERLFDIRLSYLIVVYLMLSCVFHAFVASRWGRARYFGELRNGQNRFRWVEYAGSSGLMILMIAMVFGIGDVAGLLGLVGANAAMIFFGWVMEVVNEPGDEVWWTPFWFGCIVGAVPWIGLLAYLIGPGKGMPGFVYGVFVSLFVFFNLFAVNQWLQYKRIGRWADYLFGERVYLILSLTAKSALAWQIYGNTLAS